MEKGVFFEKLKAKVKRLFTKSNYDILVELVRANFKDSDYNSILGILWSFIGPASTLIVMYFIFKIHFGGKVEAYPLFLLIGIVSVNFFIVGTIYIMKIFFTGRGVILNLILLRENLILSHFFIYTFKFLVELLICLMLSIFYGFFSWGNILLLLPLFIAYLSLVLGISLILLLIFCFVRDIEHIWMIISRLFLFVTPVFYSLEEISPRVRSLIYWMNPLTPFLISFRDIFMHSKELNAQVYTHSLLLGFFFLLLGYCAFVVFENAAVEAV